MSVKNTANLSIVLAMMMAAFVFFPNRTIAKEVKAISRCFLHGIISPTVDNKEKSSLSDMIRMHFDADEKAKCEQMFSAYCQYNVKDKNYLPNRLKGSFKPDIDKSEEYIYTFTDKCKLVTDD